MNAVWLFSTTGLRDARPPGLGTFVLGADEAKAGPILKPSRLLVLAVQYSIYLPLLQLPQ